MTEGLGLLSISLPLHGLLSALARNTIPAGGRARLLFRTHDCHEPEAWRRGRTCDFSFLSCVCAMFYCATCLQVCPSSTTEIGLAEGRGARPSAVLQYLAS
jgi:hypothetical protein